MIDPHPSSRTAAILALALCLCCCSDCPADKAARTGHTVRAKAMRTVAPTEGFVPVKAGSFTMGSPPDELGRYTNEQQHRVTLTRDFELAATEVTQAQFETLMGYNPSRFAGCPRCPVETVSWHEAAAYCNALSTNKGLARCYRCTAPAAAAATKPQQTTCTVAPEYAGPRIYACPGYRLPTDAEWEYAYRAGTSTPYYSGTNEPHARTSCSGNDPVAGEIGWFCQNAGGRTHEVGLKKKNPHGLADMAGNVWEWCHDSYLAVLDRAATDPWGIPESPMRVARGGSWNDYSRGMRAACRAWYKPGYRGAAHGLRPARTLSFPAR